MSRVTEEFIHSSSPINQNFKSVAVFFVVVWFDALSPSQQQWSCQDGQFK